MGHTFAQHQEKLDGTFKSTWFSHANRTAELLGLGGGGVKAQEWPARFFFVFFFFLTQRSLVILLEGVVDGRRHLEICIQW